MIAHKLRTLHSLLGLITAGFLILTGITGAIISWDHELDELINPRLMQVSSIADHGLFGIEQALAIASQIEQRYPDAEVVYLPLSVERGHSLSLFAEPRLDQHSTLKSIDFNQVFINPYTQQELGKREWGAVFPITSENFVSFLYKLHYSLHFPEVYGIDRWGIWLLGGIGVLWLINNLIGLSMTLPRITGWSTQAQAQWWRIWKKGFALPTEQNGVKAVFHWHRFLGLWLWLLLSIIAFTAFSLNLSREAFIPLMSATTNLTPSVYSERPYLSPPAFKTNIQSRDMIIRRAIEQAKQLHWEKPLGALSYSREFSLYRVDFFDPSDDHGIGGAGHDALFFDAETGQYLGQKIPWEGTAADVFVEAQFPLHSGRIAGLFGRILVSMLGLLITVMSILGVYLWWRRR
jgi:uncharacterized iron-regulated membrane protein